MEKVQELKIRAIAKILPVRQYEVNSRAKVSGEDLLLCGHKEVEGKAIEKDGEYVMPMPFYNEVNHYRRLKKAFTKNGLNGVKSYVARFVKDKVELNNTLDVIFR